jgi:hypothetical protein
MFVSVMKSRGGVGGAGHFGLRVPLADREEFFDRRWSEIEVDVGGKFHTFAIRPNFWEAAPVIREREGHTVLRDWLQRKKVTDWKPGAPHQVQLVPLGGNRFRLAV